jgi:hypothetical protein
MEDFWSTLRGGNITIVRDNIDTADSTGVRLLSGKRVDADYVIYATGWGDHFSFFSPELKEELGIPQYGDSTLENINETLHKETVPGETLADPWILQDKAADELIAKKLPLLAAGPKDFNGWRRSAARQRAVKVRRWRLYNRIVPLADSSDNHSIAILGQIHTTQTPTIAEIQALWTAAYLLGDISLPSEPDMVREVAEWNAWTRKRYASVGERYPYALFDWVPYLDRLMRDLGLRTKRHNGVLSDFFLPYSPHCYRGVVDEYMAVHKETCDSRLGRVSSASSILE